ncbi:RecQ family ATP-dependent DNA helicase [Aestuariirhabdus litorea]|uniref:DNA 3'-5' helicase n=1 Tax=Aestuariirhabdus litorea TaxID=2528527 RepID=A0A3P3VIU4_9GAMM|nr:RecQ family ATP-dependent DNA helicase [Aestuariirhabdus litorea]RRJ82592.1 RecQ family ATP-dependent DNA helicase [Aestuariirhabdus litorea]RWW92751.1 RecQ family ATP-dependent DNA helicase [Endozoicomonadaceae bacterium GTF-13]
MDVFHTGNYVRSHYNFLIKGLSEKAEFSAIASTLFNIHFRGSPTSPSNFLKSKLAEMGVKLSDRASIHIDFNSKLNWGNTILGSDTGYNPAMKFYEDGLCKMLGEFSFLHTLFKPETLITDIVDDPEADRFDKERVDFFLPIGNLVIEVDGEQHQGVVNYQKDKARDRLLSKHQIKTVRISTTVLKNKNRIEEIAREVRQHLSSTKIVGSYKKLQDSDSKHSNLVYSIIYRVQAIVIEMLGRKMISLSDDQWSLWFDTEIDVRYCNIAIQDLLNWVSLIDKSRNLPKLNINCVNPVFKIDVSLSKRVDDTFYPKNVITCRTDQFDHFPENNAVGATGKDYFDSSYSSSTDNIKIEELNLNGLLKEIFGYEQFNGGQIDIIENVLQREDTIGILPTGGGKSLCYQLPAILYSGLTLVICPIKSLMRDQVQELNFIGFHRSACIDSDTDTKEKEKILRRVGKGQVRFLFVSPERLQISNFREAISSLHAQGLLSLVVVDEVHCMSEWGHDFRTSYLTLPHTLNNIANEVPILCLTATASNKVLRDIQDEFKIDDDNVKTLSRYERKNLHFKVLECDPFYKVHELLNVKVSREEISEDRAGIVFTSYVDGPKGAYQLFIGGSGYYKSIGIFTGKKPKNHVSKNFEVEKLMTQRDFKNNKIGLLVATKAFGMGVNKKNVYTTIHAGLPQSIESLYQEAGRAGRDRTDSECYVLYKKPEDYAYDRFFNYDNFKSFTKLNLKHGGGDLSTHHFFIKSSISDNYRVPDVIKMIVHYLAYKDDGQSEIVSEKFYAKPEIVELALYRLYQIGIIEDWTVEDFAKGIYLVDYKMYSIADHNEIVRRLTASDKRPNGYGLTQEEIDNTNSMDDWIEGIYRLANFVIEYHLDTRVRSRIESLKTLLIACNEYKEKSSDAFRENLESYFAIDSINDSLSDVVSSGSDYTSILSYLSGAGSSLLKMSSEKIKKRIFSLRRYIESYPNDMGLRLINEILLFHVDKESNPEKLIECLESYRKIKLPGNDYYVCLKELSMLFNSKKWDFISKSIAMKIKSDKELDAYIRSIGSDELTLMLLNNVDKKLKKVSRSLYELI